MPVSINGSGAITFNDGSIQNTSAFFGGLAFRNRIINGAMMIDQRNAGASVTVTGGQNQFITDRFIARATNVTCTAQRSATAPAGFTNSLQLTVGTGVSPSGSDVNTISQRIEGFNIADLGWGTASAQTVTVSFWVRSSLTGTFAFRIGNGSRSYVATYTVNAANTFEYKTIVIAGDTSGTWATDNSVGMFLNWDLGSGSSLNAASANTWVATDSLRVAGSVNLTSTTGATFFLTGVQLEKGTTATAFDYRPYGTELALCQRYFVRYSFATNTGIGAGGVGVAVSTSLADSYISVPVPLRVPSNSLSLTVSNLQIYTVSSGNVVSSGTWAIPYESNNLTIPVRYNHGSSTFTQAAAQFIVGNGTTGFLSFSAEL